MSILGMTAAYLWWQGRPRERYEPPQPGDLQISIDAGHVLLGVGIVGAVGVVIAAVASMLIARRAMRPLEEALERQTRFVEDASHELRTPLTVLHSRIQLLQRRVRADEQTELLVRDLADDADAVMAVLNDLLDAAAASDDLPAGGSTSVDLLLADVLALVEHDAAQRGVSIRLAGTSQLVANMPAAQLRRCVIDILQDALAHSPAGGVITLSTSRASQFAVIDIHDDGPAPEGKEAEHLFDRFRRRSLAPQPAPILRTPPRRNSHGLGLFLVRQVAERHGGSVTVAATDGPGTTIRLLVPSTP
ncbi:HAMP domain-containing sensor histidine kinase [Cellulomonas sp. 73-92]|uniref:sensor histidine kinase n=1 Tax=Cellulomonas sp. 73-92 TaxID=1895740 RepID=UPI0025C63251|nr:HAMP domain-containing sensor histidine kinase [Cellulomonas sp. 73-92]